jgi:putative SOS response-associated peptidase YedK
VCGRYASSRGAHDLAAHFSVEEEPEEEELPPSWNVAPTDPVYAVLQRDGTRRLRIVRWGLVPSWAKDAKVGSRFINARRETVADKPAFRAAFARRRCLLPADGYYEWTTEGGRKTPWYLTSRDGSPLAMAGLYEIWRDPEGQLLWTATVMTTEAADDAGHIHDRTPLLVPKNDWARWLDSELPDPGADLLVAATSGVLDAWRVGAAVGNVRNNGPELPHPVADEPEPTLL